MSERSYSGFWGLQTGEALVELADFLSWDKNRWADFVRYMDELEKPKAPKHKKEFRRKQRSLFQQLRRRGIVETKRVRDRVLIRLTDKAWLRARIFAIRRIQDLCPEGRCLVIYDIPEEHRDERNAFRSFLKRVGFSQLQKSAWVCKYNVAQSVAAVVAELKIGPWVTVVVGRLLA